MNVRRILCLTAISFAVACNSGEEEPPSIDAGASPAAAPASTGDDMADIASYELTMEKVDRFYAAQRNLALQMRDLSPAEREALRDDDDDDDDASGGESLEAMARKFESDPRMARAIRDAGLSTREYATLTMAMVQSAMAAAVLQSRPGENQDSLVREMKANPRNVRFLRENEAALASKQAELQAELQRLGVDVQR